jgi:predicted molibdopterin-dependent oxidoreductase YjgC
MSEVGLTIDGSAVSVAAGATILDACRALGAEQPTLCWGDTLVPRNACRICVVEVDGARVLVPACSRSAEDGMVVHTDTPRVRQARRMVLELLASASDLSLTSGVEGWMAEYGADPNRYGGPPAGSPASQPVKIDNDLYIRDYAKCILCYKCVDACGSQWQNTFAISVAGRGADAHISTEFDVALPDSACVYCGNCLEVCPTGALLPKAEFDLRAAGKWDDAGQTRTDTICPYCGVGCPITLHVQDNRIVKVTSPHDAPITSGNLCIKGRFGFEHVQNRPEPDPPA